MLLFNLGCTTKVAKNNKRMTGNKSTHTALLSLLLSIQGDNLIIRKKKKISQCYAQKWPECLGWQGTHRLPVLYFQNGNNSVGFQLLQVFLGLDLEIAQSQAPFEEPLAQESWLNAETKDGIRETL